MNRESFEYPRLSNHTDRKVQFDDKKLYDIKNPRLFSRGFFAACFSFYSRW